MEGTEIDVYNTTVVQLQELQESGKITAVQIVSKYLSQIDAHNIKGVGLRAVIDIAPRSLALARAEELDSERATKGSRGPLHGIPVLVKDLFNTDPALGMGTTCGSLALRTAKPRKNSPIVDLLLDAGAIIIGKANLSEMANIKGSPTCTTGWSAAGGQGLSAYVRGGVVKGDSFLGHSTPAGSSSGSAVGVAAGFVPISIGTETDGSTVYPGNRAGVYSLKLSHGAVSMDGCLPCHPFYDCHSLFAQAPEDLLVSTKLILGEARVSSTSAESWEGRRIGVLDFDTWKLHAGEIRLNEDFNNQVKSKFGIAIKKIEQSGGVVVHNVHLPTVRQLAEKDGGADFDVIAFDNWKAYVDAYLADLEETPVRTVDEMIAFNKKHHDVCLPTEQPSQKFLEKLVQEKPDPDAHKKMEWLRETSRVAIQEALNLHQLDAIIADGDSRLCAIASLAGYACGTMPLGYADFNGRAFGVQIMAGNEGEGAIMNTMKAWEKSFPEGRQAPPLMLNHI